MPVWPARVQEIVNAFSVRYPHEMGRETGSDEDRRTITGMIAQQCRYELGPNWGHKRADAGRPLSADVFCTRDPFIGWDWSVPSSGSNPLGIAQNPDSIDLTGQVFVEVEGHDYLGVAQPNPNPTPTPTPPVDLSGVIAAIMEVGDIIDEGNAATRQAIADLAAKVDALAAQNRVFPEYNGEFRANFFGTSRFGMKPKV